MKNNLLAIILGVYSGISLGVVGREVYENVKWYIQEKEMIKVQLLNANRSCEIAQDRLIYYKNK